MDLLRRPDKTPPDTPSQSDGATPRKELVTVEQARLLYSASGSSIPAALALGLTMVYVQWELINPLVSLGWFAALVLIYLARGVLSMTYFRAAPPAQAIGPWMHAFLAGTLLAGTVWGMGAWLMYPPDKETHQAFMGVLFSGLAAGAVTSLSASRFAILSFLALAVLPLVVRFLSGDSQMLQTLGLLTLLFFVLAGVGAQRINAAIVQSLRLRLEAVAREKALRASEERLQESEEKYRRLFELSDDPMWLIVHERFVMANSAACRVLGYATVEELLNSRPEDLSPTLQPDDRSSAEKAAEMMRMAHRNGYHRFEWVHKRRNGEDFPVEVTLTRVPVEKEQALFVVWRDISERKKAEEALRESEYKYRSLMEHSPLAVQEVSPEGRVLRVNRAWERLWGVPFSALRNYNLFHDRELIERGMMPTVQKVFAGEAVEIPAHEYDKANVPEVESPPGRLWVRTFLYPLHGADGELREVVLIQEDVTERRRQEEHILYQAHFDTLTGLPNRFLALDRLSQLTSEARRNRERVAVLFIDLDDFKKINDSLGHDTGDKLLKEAASRLQQSVRAGDTVGRLGGDEFIVLLGNLAAATDARPVAEALLERFRDAFRIDDRELILTASIGIAVFPDDGESPSELLRNSDSAMYHSKGQGRNTYSYFTDEMNQGVARRLLLEEQMHGAQHRAEFSLLYQPKIDLQTRRISGVEALVRWRNPAVGDVSPMEFIPIAEQTGLIVSLGQFVLTEALAAASRWQNQFDRPIAVAVNLSPRQFRDPNLLSFVSDAVRRAGITPGSLELEITEGVLMSGHAYIDEALAGLYELGVSIAMDDFGTGYSSLSYLRKYPFDVLKIDREFINDITEDPADREVVNAAIAMAHSLGLKVVAEGVETEEQLTLLSEKGCDLAQGYLFSKPLAYDEMTALLAADQATENKGHD